MVDFQLDLGSVGSEDCLCFRAPIEGCVQRSLQQSKGRHTLYSKFLKTMGQHLFLGLISPANFADVPGFKDDIIAPPPRFEDKFCTLPPVWNMTFSPCPPPQSFEEGISSLFPDIPDFLPEFLPVPMPIHNCAYVCIYAHAQVHVCAVFVCVLVL